MTPVRISQNRAGTDMYGPYLVSNIATQERAERIVAKLNTFFKDSYLRLSFAAAPAGGSFNILVTSSYNNWEEEHTDFGAYLRETILHHIIACEL